MPGPPLTDSPIRPSDGAAPGGVREWIASGEPDVAGVDGDQFWDWGEAGDAEDYVDYDGRAIQHVGCATPVP